MKTPLRGSITGIRECFPTLMGVLSGQRAHSEHLLDVVKSSLRRADSGGCTLNPVTYIILLRIHCVQGHLSEVAKYF